MACEARRGAVSRRGVNAMGLYLAVATDDDTGTMVALLAMDQNGMIGWVTDDSHGRLEDIRADFFVGLEVARRLKL